MSDQPPYHPASGTPPQHPQPGGEQTTPQWPGQYPDTVPPVYPPPPEHYTRENYPLPVSDPAMQYSPYVQVPAYPQYPQYAQYPQQGMYVPPGYGAPPMPREQGSGMAVAGLILGIVSIPAALVLICGPIVGVIGIILSALGRRSIPHRSIATVGLTLSIIGVALSLAFNAFSLINHLGPFTTP